MHLYIASLELLHRLTMMQLFVVVLQSSALLVAMVECEVIVIVNLVTIAHILN